MIKYTVEINDEGNIFWYKECTEILHRENDLPAIECSDGHKQWWINDLLIREEFPDGSKLWYVNCVSYNEAEYLKLTAPTPPDPFDGTTVTIDGKKYKLTFITP